MQTKEKKSADFDRKSADFSWFDRNLAGFSLEQATLQRSLKTKQFFSQVQFVCCLYTMTSFFSTSLNMSDSLLMPCDRKKQKQQQQKYYDEFSFSLNLEKKCCQNTNKLFIKKNMGSTSHYLNN